MKKSNKLKIGILLIGVIAITGYILDDIFYYSGNKLAEIFILPLTLILILPLAIYFVLPYFLKNK
jgi:hypothetical protein